MLFRRYLQNQGAHISLNEISAASANYTKLDDEITAALAHEQMITASISEFYSAALDCKDYSTTQFLDWFIKEQVEEEKTQLISARSLSSSAVIQKAFTC